MTLTIKDAFAQLLGHVVVQLREAAAARRFSDALTWAEVGLSVVLVDEKVREIVTDAGKTSKAVKPFTSADINCEVRISAEYEGIHGWARGHIARVVDVSDPGLVGVRVGDLMISFAPEQLERGHMMWRWEPSA